MKAIRDMKWWQKPHFLIPLIVVLLYLLSLSHRLDMFAFNALIGHESEGEWWHSACRFFGDIKLWIILSFLFFIEAGVSMMLLKGVPFNKQLQWLKKRFVFIGLFFIIPALSALVAEAMKILIRRHRPPRDPDEFGVVQPWDGEYVFRAWEVKPFSSSGLGLASSHTSVAIAGGVLLCYLFPRWIPLWLILAFGCGLTRILDRAHFVSDVYVGTLIGVAVALLGIAIMKRFEINRPFQPYLENPEE